MRRPAAATTVGVIADTHGLLRPAVVGVLSGCDAIVHAGDIGRPEVLVGLREIAPLIVVRGNVDLGWARALPDTAEFSVAGKRIYVLHNLKELDVDPRAAGFEVVISGHSHQPTIERREEVLYVNPGSAGPRRFRLPVAVARIEVSAAAVEARIVELKE
jgi:putative phosphoesterase